MEGTWTGESSSVVPATLPPDGSFELIQESATARVRRWRSPSDPTTTVILKDPLGAGANVRLLREREILQRLDGVPGVPGIRHLGEGIDPDTIVEEDVGDLCLAQMITPGGWHAAQVIGLGVSLARTLAQVHRRGVVHRDVNPSNIVLSERLGGPVLVDFDLATTYAQERLGATDAEDVVGTLPYLAPEQTGRTGRVIDHRADLYGLGATLYEAACGHPPFGREDALRLIHEQLARVPVPLIVLKPELPETLSRIVARLLEKEPDRRYQSAEGLLHDLTLLRSHLADGAPALIRLGERDFPLRLSAPSQLVGRDQELAGLEAALENVTAGGGRCVLVSGGVGVGKSSLLNELRLPCAGVDGWFVVGKFDEYRQDPLSNALAQVMRGLGRLLLAEPEARLSAQRTGIVEAVGANAPLLAVFPEFAVLLGTAGEVPEAGLAEVQGRLVRACADVLRVVASPQRPLVLVLDDLQWASAAGLDLIDTLLIEQLPPGLLLAGAFRDEGIDASHPLGTKLARWQTLDVLPTLVRLGDLSQQAVGELLALMLRLSPTQAGHLAATVREFSGGNPFDTVELVNSLRSEGLLVPGDDGWVWDPAEIRRFATGRGTSALVAAQFALLPQRTQAGVEVMACLGVQVSTAVLGCATGSDEASAVEQLAPALECGLLVQRVDAAGRSLAVSFRHDQTREVVYRGLPTDHRVGLHLSVARRLAGSPDTEGLAAEQYLRALEVQAEAGPGAEPQAAVLDPAERRSAAALMHRAGRTARLTNSALSERLLVAAAALVAPPGCPDPELAQAIDVDLHATLHQLGRLTELDELYDAIAARCDDPLDLVGPACVQIAALTSQARSAEGLELGLRMLAAFGTRPPEQLGDWIAAELDALARWVEEAGDEQASRPELSDRRLRAVAELIHNTLAPAFLCDPLTHQWLMLTGQRMWMDHGPCPELVYGIGTTAALLIGLREDYRAAYRLVRLGLAVGDARRYEPATSSVRFLSSACVAHWFEPLEDQVGQLRTARDRLLQGGDPTYAVMTANVLAPAVLDVEPTLDACARETDNGLMLAVRTGSAYVMGVSLAYRQMVRALRGETTSPAGFDDEEFDEVRHLSDPGVTPMAVTIYHVNRALVAALLGEPVVLAEHSARAMQGLPFVPGFWVCAHARTVRALALADRLRAAGEAPADRQEALAELDACRDWLAARAEDAPQNLVHLLGLVEAERHWARGELREAGVAFDAALRDLSSHRRPWQAALITERAGTFLQSQGQEHLGLLLLARARGLYQLWGAQAKVVRLLRDHPALRMPRYRPEAVGAPRVAMSREDVTSAQPVGRRTGVAGSGSQVSSKEVGSGDVAVSGVLAATRALGQETDLDRLCAQVTEVIGRLAAATGVQIVLRNDQTRRSYLLAAQGHHGAAMLPLTDPRAGRQVPLSAVRFVDRIDEPLLVRDAMQDDRFSRDPFFADRDSCSMMAVPLPTTGPIHATLLLQNWLSGSAFTSDRLQAVLLVADHLAIALQHALAERFRALVHRSSDLSLVCGRDGSIVYATPAAVRFFGLSGTAPSGVHLSRLIRPENEADVTAWLWRVTGRRSGQDAGQGSGQATGPDSGDAGRDAGDAGRDAGQRWAAGEDAAASVEPLECPVLRPEGEPSWVELDCTDLTAHPIVGGLVIHLREVGERHRLQAELQRARRLEAIGHLAAGVTHEIKTPIQYVGDNLAFLAGAFADLCRVVRAYREVTRAAAGTQAAPGAPAGIAQAIATAEQASADADLDFLLEDVPRALEQSQDGIARVRRIVDAMKASVHPGANDRAQVDLNELIRTTLVVAHNEIKYVADVRQELADLPLIWCCPGDLQQVVLNLVVNAAQAIGEAVKAGAPRGCITVHTHRRGDEVVLEVSDTGAGIPQDIAARVFEEFFTTKPVGVGSGQGLAVVRKLVAERHGGTISFSSPPGMGTTFTVRLPIGGRDEPVPVASVPGTPVPVASVPGASVPGTPVPVASVPVPSVPGTSVPGTSVPSPRGPRAR